MGVIKESHSAWSSPIVLTPTPDGTDRFCNDLRKLNEISKFDTYPVHRVDELIEWLGASCFVSTLNLTKGYWQVPITETTKEKTALSTPDGLYHYKVLPFVVYGVPATFQRMMDQVLQLHHEYATSYLDDIIIHRPNWSSHLDHLRTANRTVNPKKCYLGLEEAVYLGYTIWGDSVRPQLQKVETITTLLQPVTKRQVKTFLGLGYYQSFISHFATLAGPLPEMTRKNHPHHVTWNAEAYGGPCALSQF